LIQKQKAGTMAGMTYAIAAFLQPIFWFCALGLSLWLVRRYAPGWERVLFKLNVFQALKLLLSRRK
jgi:hypothetical protein